MVLDAPAGQIRRTRRDRRDGDRTRVERVSFVNVPSFILRAAVPVRLGAREIRADVAFGGAFYAIVDAEAAGMPVRPEHLSDLRRAGMAIKHAVEAAVPVVHPDEPQLRGIYGTIFTGPPSSEDAHLRNVTIFAEAEVDRSPCGTGTCAVMAVLAAMGLLGAEQTFVHESIIGTRFRGRVPARRRSASCRRSCPRSRAKPTSPARTCSSSTSRTRCGTGSGFSFRGGHDGAARRAPSGGRLRRLRGVGPDERRRVVLEKAVQVHLPDAGAAELALVEDGEEERREQRDRGVPQVDGPHFPARDVQRQPLLDRGQQRLEGRLQIARADAIVVEAFGQADDVRADPAHVLQPERRAVQHPADRLLEGILGRRDERPIARRLAALPDQVRLDHALPIREVVAQRRNADAGGAGHLAEARPRQ